MMFLIRFWRSLTKKDSVESAKYEMQIFFFLYFSFWTDFSRIRIFPDRIQSFGRWIRTQEKKLIWIRKKTRMRNTALIPLFPFFYLTKNSIALLTLIRVAYQPLRYQRRGLLEVFVQLLWYPPPPNTSPARLI